MTKLICDMCGKPIESEEYPVIVTVENKYAMPIKKNPLLHKKYDLHRKCAELLINCIESMPSPFMEGAHYEK